MKEAAPPQPPPADLPPGQRVGYVRVSTVDQSTARQLDGVKLDRVFEDKCSGATTDRPELKQCLAYLRAGDTLFVHSIDRLARNLVNLLDLVGELNARGVTVHFVKEGQIYRPGAADPVSTLMLTMLGAFAQFERALIRERQREGIALARQAGAYKGRPASITPEKLAELRERDKQNGGRGRAALAREFGISRSMLYVYLADQVEQADQADSQAA